MSNDETLTTITGKQARSRALHVSPSVDLAETSSFRTITNEDNNLSPDKIPRTPITPADSNTALISNSNWSLIPKILAKRHLQCMNQTPESASKIHAEYGLFGDGKALSHDVERTLMEAFIEDDYDGSLHLTTIHEVDNIDMDDTNIVSGLITPDSSIASTSRNHAINAEKRLVCDSNMDSDIVTDKNSTITTTATKFQHPGKPIGLVFWREVPTDEMEEWLDMEKLSIAAATAASLHNDGNSHMIDSLAVGRSEVSLKQQQHQLLSQEGAILEDKEFAPLLNIPPPSISTKKSSNGIGERSLSLVRQHSLTSLGQLSTSNNAIITENEAAAAQEKLTHSWIKIELLAVKEEHWGQRLGSLLLACALYQAYTLPQNSKTKCVLHVAGGSDNIPAVRLYSRFGFLPAAEGIFRKPNRDLYVLGNIGVSLASLAWSGVLM